MIAGTGDAPFCMYAAVKRNISDRSEDLLSKGIRIVSSFSASKDQSTSSFSLKGFLLACLFSALSWLLSL